MPFNAVFCGYCGIQLKKVTLDSATIDIIKQFRRRIRTPWSINDFINKKGFYIICVDFLKFLKKLTEEISGDEELVEEVIHYKEGLEAAFTNIKRCCDIIRDLNTKFDDYNKRAGELEYIIKSRSYDDEEYDDLMDEAEVYINRMKYALEEMKKYEREYLEPEVEKFISKALEVCDIILKSGQ